MNHLVRARQTIVIEALIDAEDANDAADAFNKGAYLYGEIVEEGEPEIIEVLEAP